jgi:hypothetical protein
MAFGYVSYLILYHIVKNMEHLVPYPKDLLCGVLIPLFSTITGYQLCAPPTLGPPNGENSHLDNTLIYQ